MDRRTDGHTNIGTYTIRFVADKNSDCKEQGESGRYRFEIFEKTGFLKEKKFKNMFFKKFIITTYSYFSKILRMPVSKKF